MNCNICDSEIEEDNGDIVGQFGISQVAFKRGTICRTKVKLKVIDLNVKL